MNIESFWYVIGLLVVGSLGGIMVWVASYIEWDIKRNRENNNSLFWNGEITQKITSEMPEVEARQITIIAIERDKIACREPIRIHDQSIKRWSDLERHAWNEMTKLFASLVFDPAMKDPATVDQIYDTIRAFRRCLIDNAGIWDYEPILAALFFLKISSKYKTSAV